ncbi:Hypothetical protein PHPALM_4967 [Phytophthora palmivora]|uniref:Uncharacterized protein n=1 Tax=Phytophthora palmivora TaxID=4796 RepID=A0A2P4YIJ7_9STRA|nr:Hypothetical protein PHPALM_4967 [Phytophthora palmivora]
MRKTYLCVLKQKVERFNKEFATKKINGWFDSKHHPSLNEGKLKGIAAGCDSAAYKQWKDEYEVKELIKTPSATIDDMRLAMADTSFEIDELEYWAEKYLVIENKPNRDFDLNFSTFEKMLKTTSFESLHLLKRFVLYFNHEFYVFEGSDITYYKRKPTDDNPVIKAYDPKNFFEVQIQYTENKKQRSTKLSDLLNTIPFHKFTNTVCKWEHDPNDMETFSLANPLLAKDFHEAITESDLHPVLVDYLKRIICFNDSERYQWLMEFIGSICYYPDNKTKVMLMLYSMEKQIGKSNFFKLLTSLL